MLLSHSEVYMLYNIFILVYPKQRVRENIITFRHNIEKNFEYNFSSLSQEQKSDQKSDKKWYPRAGETKGRGDGIAPHFFAQIFF